MIWIVCLVVIIQMTTNTGIGGGIVITVMANNALVGYCHMGSCQDIIIIMDWESSRGPVRICCMTGCTCSRDTDSAMIRIGRLVIICLMTSNACIGGIDIITLVTRKAIAGNGGMCTGQRVNIVMIECRGTPCALRMTGFTGSRELRRNVIRVCRLIVLSGMAAKT